jgi:hypothetical protein
LLLASFEGWLTRVELERLSPPTPDEVYGQLGLILPALRHTNDLEAVVSAMQARPDWVISTNTDHWGPPLAARTGLRTGTPMAFLEEMARIYHNSEGPYRVGEGWGREGERERAPVDSVPDPPAPAILEAAALAG